MSQHATVYITGAASGIGLEVAKRHAAEGANLALFDLNVTQQARDSIQQHQCNSQQKIQLN